uniref:Potassium channel domain-containing protein n=1 Tax=Timema shepardi TaxID=629360 RepID=A0A7R9AUE5_TIMSH|nr:unnamed protein product [Timema shepardi]
MMSKKQWCCLLILFVVYLMMGAVMFNNIEGERERARRIVEAEERRTIHGEWKTVWESPQGSNPCLPIFVSLVQYESSVLDHAAAEAAGGGAVVSPLAAKSLPKRSFMKLLDAHYVDFLEDDHYNILTTLEEYCGKKLVNISTEGDEDPILWDFYNSVFFVITVVSTIGYGNLVPTSALGRILMILYAIIGIPMNGILLTALGEFFSKAGHRPFTRERVNHEFF